MGVPDVPDAELLEPEDSLLLLLAPLELADSVLIVLDKVGQ